MESVRPSSVPSSERVQRVVEAAASGPLAAYLHTQRWFGGKGRVIRSVQARDHAVIDPGAAGKPCYLFALFDVAYDDGSTDLYSVPLVLGTGGAGNADSIVSEIQVDGTSITIADACADERFARMLLATIARGGTIPSARGGAIVGASGGASINGLLGGDAIEALPVKRLRAEQSNTSIVYAPGGRDRIVVKCVRRVPEGTSVEVEIGHLLTRVGFKGAPATLGDVAYVPPPKKGTSSEPLTLAVAQTFVANVGDGWGHALADLRARIDTSGRASRPSREPYAVAMRALGRTTAEMHLALAAERRDPAFAPEPLGDDDRERLATNAAAKLVEIIEWVETASSQWPEELRPVANEVVQRAPALADRLRQAQHLPRGLSKTRVHGDYHLGQVLRVHEDDGRASWTIVDFEGEPLRPLAERRAKSSPLRDVAGMLRSFDYAAFAAVRDAKVETPRAELEGIARNWRDAARDEFLQGWLSLVQASDVPLVPADAKSRADALALFELDKALYELAYEIENRPDWIAIPLRGIHALMR